MQAEVELKLEIDPAFAHAFASWPDLAGCGEAARLHAVYFDTPARDLRAAGLSLRVRRSGRRRLQTVKAEGGAAAGLFVRREWEMPVRGNSPVLDARTPVAALLGADVDLVAPIFTVDVERRTWLLQEGDAAVELVLDTGHIQAGDRSQALCEIELELKHGPVNALFALARRIDGHVPVRIGMRSKSERGYGLNDEMPAAFKAEPVALAADSSIADAFARIAAACLRQYRLNEQRLLQGYQPAALHQARVAVRRIRSALTVFRPVLDRSGARQLGAELRWLAGVLGEARDLDVLLAGLAADHPQRAQLEEAQGAAQARVLQWLESARVRLLMLDVAEWLALDPVEAEAGRRPAAPFAARRLTKYRRRVVKGGRGMERLSDEARHAVRKDAKKLRYGAEFLADLFNGKKARRRRKAFIAALEGLQDDLGALNDLASAPAMLARHGAGEPAAPASEPERAALLAAAARGRRALADAPRFWT